MSNLEPRYTLFDSVEEMLAPETLSELLSKPVTRVSWRPMNGHSGLAGGQLSTWIRTLTGWCSSGCPSRRIGSCLPAPTNNAVPCGSGNMAYWINFARTWNTRSLLVRMTTLTGQSS